MRNFFKSKKGYDYYVRKKLRRTNRKPRASDRLALKECRPFLYLSLLQKARSNRTQKMFWDDKSKIWETKNGKLAVTCVAMDNEEHTIVGYRTFTDIFNITGRVAKFPTSEAVQ